MRYGLLCLVVSLVWGGELASAQTGDEEAIKAVVRAETKAWIDRNAEAWQATWLHDATVSRVIVQATSYTSEKGWANISAPMLKDLKDNPTPLPFNAATDHFVARQQGNLAFVEYDQTLTAPGSAASGSPSREYRVLAKTPSGWKITTQITHIVDSFDDSPGAIESRINGTGQSLLRSGKHQEAIEVLKMNVRLYPTSAAALNGLAAGYVASGQKNLAVQNYEQALKLDPKNDGARSALAKLKTP
jgi:tetratricopeptide (TPR) repeat protein